MREKAANFQEDFVRIEVATAVSMGKILAPICIKDAKIPPTSSLPPDLRPLLEHNIAYLDSGRDFLDTIQNLVEAVETEFSRKNNDSPPLLSQPVNFGDINNLADLSLLGRQYPTSGIKKLSPLPQNVDNLINSGLEKVSRGDFDGAIEDYSLVLQYDSRNFNAYANMANAQYRKGDYSEALVSSNEAIHLSPENDSAHFLRGAINYYLNNYKEAIVDCTQAIRLGSSQLDRVYYIRANSRFKVKDIEGAIADYTEALEYDRYFLDALWERGEIYRRDDNFDLAIADYDQIIEINPEYVHAYIRKADIYCHKENWDEAIAVYTELVGSNPQFAEGFGLRSYAYEMVRKYDEAIIDCTRAIQLDPENAASHYRYRGLLRAKKDDTNGAIKDYSTAIRLCTDDDYLIEIYIERAKIYEELRRCDEAIEDLTAISNLPNSGMEGRIALGKIEELGKKID